jgi:hypothetical protein
LIDNVEDEINKTLNDQTKKFQQILMSIIKTLLLRSIPTVTTQQVDLAKLRTDNLTPETWVIEMNDWLGGSNEFGIKRLCRNRQQ